MYSSVDRNLGGFCLLALVNSAAANIYVRVFEYLFLVPLGVYSGGSSAVILVVVFSHLRSLLILDAYTSRRSLGSTENKAETRKVGLIGSVTQRCGLNVCPLPSSYVEILMSTVVAVGGGAFGR